MGLVESSHRIYIEAVPRLRHLTPADADDLALIESAAWRAAYAGILPARYLSTLTHSRLKDRWNARLRDTNSIAAWGVMLGGRVVGYSVGGACRDGDMEPGFAGEVYELYVHPRLQRRGLGRDLLEQTWAELEGAGFRWGVLWVLEDNHSARRFYAHADMQPDGARRRLRHAGVRVPAVRYARPLSRFDPFAEGALVTSGQ